MSQSTMNLARHDSGEVRPIKKGPNGIKTLNWAKKESYNLKSAKPIHFENFKTSHNNSPATNFPQYQSICCATIYLKTWDAGACGLFQEKEDGHLAKMCICGFCGCEQIFSSFRWNERRNRSDWSWKPATVSPNIFSFKMFLINIEHDPIDPASVLYFVLVQSM